jgi:hypothetical protein
MMEYNNSSENASNKDEENLDSKELTLYVQSGIPIKQVRQIKMLTSYLDFIWLILNLCSSLGIPLISASIAKKYFVEHDKSNKTKIKTEIVNNGDKFDLYYDSILDKVEKNLNKNENEKFEMFFSIKVPCLSEDIPLEDKKLAENYLKLLMAFVEEENRVQNQLTDNILTGINLYRGLQKNLKNLNNTYEKLEEPVESYMKYIAALTKEAYTSLNRKADSLYKKLIQNNPTVEKILKKPIEDNERQPKMITFIQQIENILKQN